MDFGQFKDRITAFLDDNNITYDDIKYISLNKDFWINIQDLMLLDMPPKVLELDNLDYFKIVLHDYRWISYDYVYDSFIMNCPPVKPPKKYFIPKMAHKLTIGDFITKHQQNYLNK
jgi:hypothetical protein